MRPKRLRPEGNSMIITDAKAKEMFENRKLKLLLDFSIRSTGYG